MKILILSIRAGYGHHSAAKAIMEAFLEDKKEKHECIMLDMFDYINKHLGNSIQDGYLLSTKFFPAHYGRVYGRLDKKDEPYDKTSAVSIAAQLVSKKLESFSENFMPDLVIGTHSYACMVMTVLVQNGIIKCPTMGIITDFTIHPFWESTVMDYYVIPTDLLSHNMVRKGIPYEKILPFGIPLKKCFEQKHDRYQARTILNMEDKKTILIVSGSMGYGNIKKTLAEVDDFPDDFQIICVCGSNTRAKSSIEKKEWKKTVHIYGFTDNMDLLMDASDFIISKPGGLTTSEALAKQVPMIIVNPLPGQEDRNADFLVNCGAAIKVDKYFTLSDALFQVLRFDWRVEFMTKCINELAHPNSARELYSFIRAEISAPLSESENSASLR